MKQPDNLPSVLIVTGPTASGKTRRAVDIARMLNGEIISADSRQVYRGMDLGTGKDIEEYGETPYHLIDIAPAGSKYNLFRFLDDARTAADMIIRRGHLPVMCGGTGLYVESFLKGLRLPEVPENPGLRASLKGKTLDELTRILATMKTLHNSTDVDSVQRAIRAIEIQTYYISHPDAAAGATPSPIKDAIIIGIAIDREARRQRITARLKQRLDNGMLDEIRTLLAAGIRAEDLMYYGLEYKYLTLHVIGLMTFEGMFEKLEMEIHRFAKRQMTWFRGMERRGFKINWLDWDMADDEFRQAVIQLIENRN